MNEKEVAEIRRRFRPEKNNITHVHGCYVNDKGEIISEFHQSLSLMPQEEAENILGVLKRGISGTLGKNLIDINFATQQVVDSDEHRLLMALKNTKLQDDSVLQAFYAQVIAAIHLEGTYLILLAYDTYDIPFRGKDGGTLEDASSEMYSYILCTVCPVKTTKPVLSYHVPDSSFHNCGIDWLVAPPELGFLFPAFNDRSADIYAALYYSKDIGESHQEFVDAVFKCEIPMPAAVQKETFSAILGETLAESCSFDVVQAINGQLCEMVEEHKVNKEIEPLVISKKRVKGVLETCGVPEAAVEAFEEKYNEEFGAEADIRPRNIIDQKQFQVSTPNVTIKVSPECSNLLETRTIDGTKYILIRAEEGVEVNGVNIYIP